MDIIDKFKELPFSQAAISSFLFVPSEKIVLGVEVILDKENFCDDCELQFNRILHHSIQVTGNPWFGIVKEYSITKESEYMNSITTNNKPVFVKIGDFYHFSILTDNAKLDILAESFTFSVIRRADFKNDYYCS